MEAKKMEVEKTQKIKKSIKKIGKTQLKKKPLTTKKK